MFTANHTHAFTARLRDAAAVRAYVDAHANAGADLHRRIRAIGIERQLIFRRGRALFMLVELRPGATLEQVFDASALDADLRAWSAAMRGLLETADEERARSPWTPLELIFQSDDD